MKGKEGELDLQPLIESDEYQDIIKQMDEIKDTEVTLTFDGEKYTKRLGDHVEFKRDGQSNRYDKENFKRVMDTPDSQQEE